MESYLEVAFLSSRNRIIDVLNYFIELLPGYFQSRFIKPEFPDPDLFREEPGNVNVGARLCDPEKLGAFFIEDFHAFRLNIERKKVDCSLADLNSFSCYVLELGDNNPFDIVGEVRSP